jgi:hypothetical protein
MNNLRTRLQLTNVDPLQLYLNVLVVNDSPNFIRAAISETRTTPILVTPNKYKMAIVRFSVPTTSLPIFNFKSNPDNTPNNTFYSVTLTYGSQVSLAYVNYLTEEYLNIKTQPPNPVYSFNNFILMVNTALVTAFTGLTGIPGTAQPPYFTYTASTGLLSLYCSQEFIDFYPFTNTGIIHLYMNIELFSYFDGFNVNFLGVNSVNGLDVKFVITKTGNNDQQRLNNPTTNIYPIISTGYVMTCEFDNVSFWATLRQLIFQSSTLPVVPEFYQSNKPSGAGSVTQSILTDFEPIIQRSIDSRAYQQYQAQLYRYIDLVGTDPLKSIDFNINWSDANGNVYPLYLAPFQTMSIKILFELK